MAGAWAALMKYLKPAFLWRWNLLAFGGGVVFALLSGQPDVVLPLLMAGEITYLGMLASHPRFRKAVDVRVQQRSLPPIDQSKALEQIKGALKPEAWERFENLRDRCLSLNDLGRQFRGPQAIDNDAVKDLQTSSLERLLWLFLKLLYSQDALQRFLRVTDRTELEKQLASTQKDLDTAKAQERDAKLVGSLQDKYDTLKQRLANYEKAEDHREFLAVEIDRIEQKVNAISEMTMNARDPADISAQVDGIAEGVSATEDAMRQLDVAPVFEREEAPRLLSTEM